MPSEHSDVVGGSTAARVIACPGSVREVRKAPPQESSPYARTGTMLHDVMETYLSCNHEHTANMAVEKLIGKTIKGVEFTPELYETKIVPCMDWFENTLAPDDFFVETKCRFPGIPGAFGTADIIYRKGNEYGVADWKFGDGVPVQIESNAQIMFYLWAAIHTKHNFFPPDHPAFRGHIFQPFRSPDMEKHQAATFTFNELEEFSALLIDAVAIAEQADAPLAIGDHCKFCAAKAFCPALRDVAAGIMEQKDRTPAQMIEALAYADSLEQLVKEIRREAHDYVERGNTLEGWKLVNSLSNRFFKPGAELELRRRGFRVKDIYPKTMGTPAHMERVIKARGLTADIDDLTDRKVNGTKLVPETAKGEAVVPVTAKLKKLAHMIKAKNLRC